jgi:probable F420-dependent oxidoreductase
MAFAAAATGRISIGTGVAIAHLMTVALAAHDLQRASGGCFLLGLGSQVRAHVERRFSMPWSAPAPRMREFVLAVRAIWAAWQEQTPLDFRGEYFTHTLMSPVFDPGPNACGLPSIHLAGVGELMTQVAAEAATPSPRSTTSTTSRGPLCSVPVRPNAATSPASR